MALQKEITLTDSFGEDRTFSNAYHKITQISGNKGMLQVVITSFASSDGAKLRDITTGFEPSLSGSNFIAQAYEHVKTLDEFQNAGDV